MFIHLSLQESVAVIGMPSPEMKKKFTLCYQIINSLESVGMEGTHESMVEKGIKFIFCLGTACDISSMGSIGNYSIVFVDRKSMPPKMFYLYLFALSSSTSTNPYFPLRRAFLFYFMQFLFLFESPSYLIKHQLWGTLIVLEHYM